MTHSLNRFSFLLVALLLATRMASSQGGREAAVLPQNWHFQMDVEDLGEKEQWHGEGFDHSAWSKVTVPGAWDLYNDALWGYEGIGWYSITLDPALARPRKVQILRFGRVMYHTKVWLNGEFLGENIGGYLPFTFDVTSRLRSEKPNVLVLRVDNRPRLQWLPGARNIEWMQYGGILEPVLLESTSRTYLADLAISAVPQGPGASLDCTVAVVSRDTTEKELTLRLHVEGAERATRSVTLTLPPGATSREHVLLSMDRASRWSPASPSLYTLRATLESGGKPVDGVASRFGVRKIEVRGRQMLLNGAPIRLQGVNRYDEYGRYGPNAPRPLVIRDLRRMKSAGVNFVRVHFPQSPELLALYDEMGFLMMEEVTLNWWGNGFSGKGDEVQRDDILTYAMPFLEKMIRRDRNHPAVVFWSMCNESATDNEIGTRVMRRLIHRAKELDGTRPVTFVLATRESQDHRAFEDADFVSINVYAGGYHGKPARHTAEVRELIGKAAEEYIRRQLAAWPDKPMIVAEFGTPGVPGIHGDVTYTEEYQAALIEEVWKAIGRCPELSGGVLWCWADYYHRRNYIKYAPFGPYGVVTVDRRPKAALDSLVRMYGGKLAGADR